jgi:thiol:disulfide interchange protein DsbC
MTVIRLSAIRVLAPILTLSWALQAQAVPSNSEIAKTVKQNLEARFPQAKVLDVQPSAIPGLYEVFMGSDMVYADAAGDYVVMGPLVDAQTHQNLTEARLDERGKVDFNTLPLNRAIKVVKGNGSRKFAVFSDPDCPFCQQFEKSLLSVTDVTMYVFLYPITSLHPQAGTKAHAIWCAQDRAAAWSQWMHEKKLPAETGCSGDPIDELQKLGDALHINSTPTMFFANGRRVRGAIEAAQLEKDLSSTAPSSSAAAATGSSESRDRPSGE